MKKKVKIVAHRGASGYAPENTLMAFKKAIELGCDKIELDVRLTKDKKVIVIHDDDVDRTTDGRGKVAELTLKQIKKFNCEERQKIPTLQEVIDLCKGKIDLQIELKTKGTARRVYDLIVENGILDDVTITSFKTRFLQEMSILNRRINLGLLFEEYIISKKIVLWVIGWLIGINYVCPNYPVVNKKIVNRAHKLGMKVYVFDVKNKKEGEKLINMGVDEIGTDFPKLFL